MDKRCQVALPWRFAEAVSHRCALVCILKEKEWGHESACPAAVQRRHLADDALHDLANLGVAQPRFGLPLKLGVRHLTTDPDLTDVSIQPAGFISKKRGYHKCCAHTLTDITAPSPSRMWSPDRLTCSSVIAQPACESHDCPQSMRSLESGCVLLGYLTLNSKACRLGIVFSNHLIVLQNLELAAQEIDSTRKR